MKIKILSSGSKGNCYKISDGYSALLMECGITINEIKKKLNFDLLDIDGCLITHEHKDHSKAYKELSLLGLNIYMTKGTKEALGAKGHNIKTFNKTNNVYDYMEIGTFVIMPFMTVHDVIEPVGFLIRSIKTNETLLFLTDSMYSKYWFDNVEYIMLEVNYVKEVINDNHINKSLRKRIKENHMSLETALKFLKSCDLSKTKEIYIMHLSDSNSDENYIKEEVQKVTGKPIIIC